MALNIIKGIFGVDPTDLLPGIRDTGAFSRNPLEGGMMPDLAPKMMIGEGGLRNLEAAGMPQSLQADELAFAKKDFDELGADQFARTDWLGKGVEIDVNADKVMYEIPDNEVRILKGKDPEKIKGDIGFLELFKADLLENAYPDLGELKLRFYDDPESSKAGGYDPVKNVLTINRKHDYVKQNGLKKTILHEVQHFVQNKEGFTMGESSDLRLAEEKDYVLGVNALKKALDSNMVRQDVVKFLAENPNQNFNASNVVKAITMLADNPKVDAKEVLKESFKSADMADKFMSKANAYPALKGVLESKELAEDGYRSAFKKYTGVGGEAFANATMVRGEMTEPQLRATPARDEIAAQGFDVNTLLPSMLEARLAGKPYADPMESSIQSSIPKGL